MSTYEADSAAGSTAAAQKPRFRYALLMYDSEDSETPEEYEGPSDITVSYTWGGPRRTRKWIYLGHSGSVSIGMLEGSIRRVLRPVPLDGAYLMYLERNGQRTGRFLSRHSFVRPGETLWLEILAPPSYAERLVTKDDGAGDSEAVRPRPGGRSLPQGMQVNDVPDFHPYVSADKFHYLMSGCGLLGAFLAHGVCGGATQTAAPQAAATAAASPAAAASATAIPGAAASSSGGFQPSGGCSTYVHERGV